MTFAPARELISHFARAIAPQGNTLAAYRDAYGRLAIGHDHTRSALNDQRIDASQADALLDADLGTIRQHLAELLWPRAREEMNEHQWSALLSFAHSLPWSDVKQATVIARINARRYIDVPHEILKHCQAQGKTLRSLVRRRYSEANLFCSFPAWLVPA